MALKKYISLLFIIISTSFISAQNRSQLYIDYINNYAELAVIQQKEYGIPASITLAQGLLESGAGQSEFARKSNNHFGIKCHDWTGEKVYHDDDARGECFRKYDNVLDSYRDHSLFLKNKPRYSFLFSYSSVDYESWAHGLKKAGYATDPSYAYKLIGLIENYELHKFDLLKNDYQISGNPKYNEKTGSVNKNKEQSVLGVIPSVTTHTVYKTNRTKYIVAESGDTYESIAEEFNISIRKLKEYNEIDSNSGLKAGTQLYLRKKKNKASYGINNHVIKSGETMYSISQTYGIRLEKLYQLNNMPYTETARIGKVLKLR